MAKQRLIFILYNLIVVGGIMCLLELTFQYLISHPAKIPKAFLAPFQHYYSYNFRNTIQMDTTCARYDSGLFYTLKPGLCRFNNVEFKTDLTINNIGTRDSEDATHDPEIIFLGDSFTMGWGTPDDSCFASFVKRATPHKTLNAGISSYGTAREIKLLNRLDTDSLKTLVIQYHNNDFEENREYVNGPFNLKISSEDAYLNFTEKVKKRSAYYFGKHCANLAYNTLKLITGHYDNYKFNPKEVRDFISVLEHSAVPLDNVQIIFFETCSYNNYISKFSDELESEIQNKTHPDYIRKIKIIKLGGILTDNDYYILDDHIKPSGHKKIADKLLKII